MRFFHLADFWLETLFQLARESATNDPDLARELRGDPRGSDWSLDGAGT